jgi:hypothetical protein
VTGPRESRAARRFGNPLGSARSTNRTASLRASRGPNGSARRRGDYFFVKMPKGCPETEESPARWIHIQLSWSRARARALARRGLSDFVAAYYSSHCLGTMAVATSVSRVTCPRRIRRLSWRSPRQADETENEDARNVEESSRARTGAPLCAGHPAKHRCALAHSPPQPSVRDFWDCLLSARPNRASAGTRRRSAGRRHARNAPRKSDREEKRRSPRQPAAFPFTRSLKSRGGANRAERSICHRQPRQRSRRAR